MVLVQARRVALVANGVALGALGLQATAPYTSPGEQVSDIQQLAPSLGNTGTGAIPAGPSPQVHVVVPGYSHLDVVTAAYTQDNGQPEPVSSTLASWAGQVVGPPAP